MQSLTSTVGRLVVVLAGALALGSCSRSEYAFLPKAAPYLGTTTAAPKARVAPVASPTATPAPKVAAAPAAERPAAPVAAAPAQPAGPVATAQPLAVTVQTPAVAEAAVVAAQPAGPVATPAPAPKLNLVQRLALHKAMHKLDKQLQKATRQGDNTASTARIDGKLRYAIIFGAISLIFFVIGGSVANVIGTVLLVIALLFLLFWLLDNL